MIKKLKQLPWRRLLIWLGIIMLAVLIYYWLVPKFALAIMMPGPSGEKINFVESIVNTLGVVIGFMLYWPILMVGQITKVMVLAILVGLVYWYFLAWIIEFLIWKKKK